MKLKGINAMHLKVIALVTMLIDHIGAILIMPMVDSSNPADKLMRIYMIMRIIGRIAFPIFAYLIVEGFVHTKNYKKYLLRVFIFSLVSIVPYNLAFGYAFYNVTYWRNYTFGNVGFTFLISLIMLYFIRKVESLNMNIILNWLARLIVVAIFVWIGFLIRCDRRGYGVLVVAGFYLFRDSKIKQMLSTIITFMDQWAMFIGAYLSLIPIYLYNGKKGRDIRYILYVFYPLHLLILALIRNFILG